MCYKFSVRYDVCVGSLLGGFSVVRGFWVGVCRVFGSSCGSVGSYLAFLGGFPVSRYFRAFLLSMAFTGGLRRCGVVGCDII